MIRIASDERCSDDPNWNNEIIKIQVGSWLLFSEFLLSSVLTTPFIWLCDSLFLFFPLGFDIKISIFLFSSNISFDYIKYFIRWRKFYQFCWFTMSFHNISCIYQQHINMVIWFWASIEQVYRSYVDSPGHVPRKTQRKLKWSMIWRRLFFLLNLCCIEMHIFVSERKMI